MDFQSTQDKHVFLFPMYTQIICSKFKFKLNQQCILVASEIPDDFFSSPNLKFSCPFSTMYFISFKTCTNGSKYIQHYFLQYFTSLSFTTQSGVYTPLRHKPFENIREQERQIVAKYARLTPSYNHPRNFIAIASIVLEICT